MRNVLRIGLLWIGVATASAPLSAHARVETAAHPDVTALTKTYLDGMFRFRPHLAAFMGDHRFDDRMMDVSAPAIAKRLAELDALEKKCNALGTPGALDAQVDLGILKKGIALERLYATKIRDWDWDARLYDSLPFYDPREVVADRLSTLMHGDFAPEADRRKSAIAQIIALPAYLRQVQAALTEKHRAPKVYVEQAIKVNLGRIEFFETELAPFVKSDQSKKTGAAALATAIAALKSFQTFLEKDLLPKANGEWRLGKDLYDQKFPLALQTERTPDEMVKRAEADFAKSRAELAEVARKLHRQIWPGQPVAEKGSAGEGAMVNKVKDELSKHHAKPDELVAAHGRKLDALRAFIEQHKLVDLPPKETLTVEAMPAYKRGSSAAEYLAPGMLDPRPDFKATYYVDPIDPTWNAARVESYLRGQNDYEVELVASHEAYPGHHTQAAVERKLMNRLRATLWNGPMVEGWAVYGTGQMVSHGWGGKENDRYRFYDLRGRMISATNLILDVKLQRGQISDEDAVRFMVEQGFQEKAMAEKKLLRAKLDSTQLCQYFLGLSEIEQLRSDVEKDSAAKRKSFVEHDFHMALIDHGPLSVGALRGYLLPTP